MAANHTFSNGIYTVVEKHVLKSDETSWKDLQLVPRYNPDTGILESVFRTETFTLTQAAETPYVVVLKKTGADFEDNPSVYLFLSKAAWAETCTGDELSMPNISWSNFESCDDHGVMPN